MKNTPEPQVPFHESLTGARRSHPTSHDSGCHGGKVSDPSIIEPRGVVEQRDDDRVPFDEQGSILTIERHGVE